jgi:hypothetical protein
VRPDNQIMLASGAARGLTTRDAVEPKTNSGIGLRCSLEFKSAQKVLVVFAVAPNWLSIVVVCGAAR